MPKEGFPELESAISLSASIADSLSATEHLIDIFAAGPELYVFRAGRQLAHFDNVLEILASVAPCDKDPFGKVTPAVAERADVNHDGNLRVSRLGRFTRRIGSNNCRSRVPVETDHRPKHANFEPTAR